MFLHESRIISLIAPWAIHVSASSCPYDITYHFIGWQVVVLTELYCEELLLLQTYLFNRSEHKHINIYDTILRALMLLPCESWSDVILCTVVLYQGSADRLCAVSCPDSAGFGVWICMCKIPSLHLPVCWCQAQPCPAWGKSPSLMRRRLGGVLELIALA